MPQAAVADGRINTTPVVVKSSPRISDFNRPFISVTVCVPGTTECQVIDNVVLDTGSTGFRVLASALGAALKLPQAVDGSSRTLGECSLFGSTSGSTKPAIAVWGPVRKADLKIADMVAPSLPIQVVNDPAFATAPDACRNAADRLLVDFGFNGILGVRGMEFDCGGCVTGIPPIPAYYGCAPDGCSAVTVFVNALVRNPVTLFGPGYDNGFVITLPPVNGTSSTAVQGTLTFGIGTRSNNQLGNAKILKTDRSGLITTIYGGTQAQALLDTGNPFVSFHDPEVQRCAGLLPTYVYCPASSQQITAVNQSVDGVRDTVSLNIVKPPADVLLAGMLGSYLDGGSKFTWGLPFYLGRTVFAAIDGHATAAGPGPYIAY